jgi:hypothetical protein
MPALVKSSVGSFAGTSGLEGTIVCPCLRKYSRNWLRSSLLDGADAPFAAAAGRGRDFILGFRVAGALRLVVALMGLRVRCVVMKPVEIGGDAPVNPRYCRKPPLFALPI